MLLVVRTVDERDDARSRQLMDAIERHIAEVAALAAKY